LTCGYNSYIIYVIKKFLKDINMTEIELLFLVILVGCGYTSWALGKKEGIEKTIDYLEQEGLLEFEDTPENNS
tara:strand:- start:2812 stop:3030 length:219 start_codon:yes stop_codon:yes gene_type:complete